MRDVGLARIILHSWSKRSYLFPRWMIKTVDHMLSSKVELSLTPSQHFVQVNIRDLHKRCNGIGGRTGR